MAGGNIQRLSQSQEQQQSVRIRARLQTKTAELLSKNQKELLEYLRTEADTNPAIDIDTTGCDVDTPSEQADDMPDNANREDDYTQSEAQDSIKENDDSTYDTDDLPFNRSTSDYVVGSNSSEEESLHDHLMQQLGEYSLDEKSLSMAQYLIGNINDNGYLIGDNEKERDPYYIMSSIVNNLNYVEGIECDREEVEQILHNVVQRMDPVGVGAMSIQECALLQLQSDNLRDREYADLATRVIKDYYKELLQNNIAKICQGVGVTPEQWENVRRFIRNNISYNPAAQYASSNTINRDDYISPEYAVEIDRYGNVTASVISRIPTLTIDETFHITSEKISSTSAKSKRAAEAAQYLRSSYDAGKILKECLAQRQKTMMLIIKTIVRLQSEYFLTADESKIRPMLLRDVAKETGLDESSVSRATKDKYVSTPYGTLSMKKFFSAAAKSNGKNGETSEDVSKFEIKQTIRKLIDEEDKRKPLSDQRLTDMLKAKGYLIERRTVAKYRDELSIPVKQFRKQI